MNNLFDPLVPRLPLLDAILEFEKSQNLLRAGAAEIVRSATLLKIVAPDHLFALPKIAEMHGGLFQILNGKK